MKRVTAGLLALAVLATAGGAVAGLTSFQEVVVGSNYAYGTLVGPHHSADNVQYIGCFSSVGPTGAYSAYCYARNAAGTSKSCNAAHVEQRNQMRAVNPSSRIYFEVGTDGSSCSRLMIDNVSAYVDY